MEPACHRDPARRTFRPARFIEDDDDPTLEMELTPAQREMLSRAAEEELRESLQDPPKVTTDVSRPAAVAAPPPTVVSRDAAHVSEPAVVRSEVPAPRGAVARNPAPAITAAVVAMGKAPAPVPAAVPRAIEIVPPVPPKASPRPAAEPVFTAADRPRVSRLTFGLLIVGLLAFSASVAYLTIPAPVTSSPPPPAEVVPALPKPVEEPAAAPRDTSSPTETPRVVPVRYANPFDSTEVFEFPPGTSESEARDAVADRLLQRARERLNLPARTRMARRG